MWLARNEEDIMPSDWPKWSQFNIKCSGHIKPSSAMRGCPSIISFLSDSFTENEFRHRNWVWCHRNFLAFLRIACAEHCNFVLSSPSLTGLVWTFSPIFYVWYYIHTWDGLSKWSWSPAGILCLPGNPSVFCPWVVCTHVSCFLSKAKFPQGRCCIRLLCHSCASIPCSVQVHFDNSLRAQFYLEMKNRVIPQGNGSDQHALSGRTRRLVRASQIDQHDLT